MLLELVDGGILHIAEDTMSYSGCDTCDYGSEYINELFLELTRYKAKFTVTQMYNYGLSVGEIMKILFPNIDKIRLMTELEFLSWLQIMLSNSTSAKVEYEITTI